jgi:hypothetical protein
METKKLVIKAARFLVLCLPALAVGCGGVTSVSPDTCRAMPPYEEANNKHARVNWQSDRIKAFVRPSAATRYVVPTGFRAIGTAAPTVNGCATFPKSHQSAVFLAKQSFRSTTIPLHSLGVTVEAIWPVLWSDARVKAFLAMVRHGFTTIPSLFPRGLARPEIKRIAVLSTFGLAGHGRNRNQRLLPNVGPSLLVSWRDPTGPYAGRTEELFLHAVAHLFNRYRARPENAHDSPLLPRIEYQEAFASWAEVRFLRSNIARRWRMDRQIATHDAWMKPDGSKPFPRGTVYAANRDWIGKRRFPLGLRLKDIRNPIYQEVEYVHYILAPFVLLAAEGMLMGNSAAVDMDDILRSLHTKPNGDLLAELSKHLPAQDIEHLKTLMSGGERFEPELLLKAMRRYTNGAL